MILSIFLFVAFFGLFWFLIEQFAKFAATSTVQKISVLTRVLKYGLLIVAASGFALIAMALIVVIF